MDTRQYYIDTIRVIAAVTVAISHYAWNFSKTDSVFFFNYFAGLGHIGVVLFFAISGYLVSNSLDKRRGLIYFFKDKLVRIFLPFMATYVIISIIFILLGIIKSEFFNLTPLSRIMYVGVDYLSFILGFFPVDNNIIKYFNLKFYWFVGEWFIGTLCILYIISPILDYFVKRKPRVIFLGSLIISVTIYIYGYNMLMHGWWFAFARLPEFLIGMLFYENRDWIFYNEKKIIKLTFLWLLMVCSISIYIYDYPIFIDRWLPLTPRSFLVSLPLTICTFCLLKKANEIYNLKFLNDYSKISYVFMLLQHIVINIFCKFIEIERLSGIGISILLVLIFLVTVYLSKYIKNCYSPLEKYLMNKL